MVPEGIKLKLFTKKSSACFGLFSKMNREPLQDITNQFNVSMNREATFNWVPEPQVSVEKAELLKQLALLKEENKRLKQKVQDLEASEAKEKEEAEHVANEYREMIMQLRDALSNALAERDMLQQEVTNLWEQVIGYQDEMKAQDTNENEAYQKLLKMWGEAEEKVTCLEAELNAQKFAVNKIREAIIELDVVHVPDDMSDLN